MKITMWIRAKADGDNGKITLRTDLKPESFDTPAIWRFSKKLVNAVKRGANGDRVEITDNNERNNHE